MTQQSASGWVPEIAYEEAADGITSQIPFIQVPNEEEMPKVVFIFESRETGEFEPDAEGEEMPITEIVLHQYADMQILKEGLTVDEYDRVRNVLGLLPLAEATQKGKQITSRVANSI